MFDRFFDMMNARCFEEAVHKRKPDLAPYKLNNAEDRLKVNSLRSYVANIVCVICYKYCSGLRMILLDIWRSGRPVLKREKGLMQLRRR